MRERRAARATVLAAILVLGLAVALAVAADGLDLGRQASVAGSAQVTSTEEPVATAPPLPTAAPTPTAPLLATASPATPVASGLAWADLDAYAVRPGDGLQLRAGGFAPGEGVTVSVRHGAALHSVADLVADEAGSLPRTPLSLPPLDAGSYPLQLAGDQSGAVVERQFSVIGFSPWVVLEQYTLAPGASTGAQGHGFRPAEAVQIFLDGSNQPLLSVQADQQGDLWVGDVVTATPADVGMHRLVFQPEDGTNLEVAYEVLPFYPVMTLAGYAGPPGSEVRFQGSGFAPGETVRTFLDQGGRRQEVASFQADHQGAFQDAGAWRVPFEAQAGELRLVAEGEQSRVARDQAFQVLRQQPWLRADRTSGPGGTEVSLQGAGFGALEQVVISAADRELVTAAADAQGALANVGPLAVPSDMSGEVEVTARGEHTGLQASTTFAAQ